VAQSLSQVGGISKAVAREQMYQKLAGGDQEIPDILPGVGSGRAAVNDASLPGASIRVCVTLRHRFDTLQLAEKIRKIR
jgi:hypothetical protein